MYGRNRDEISRPREKEDWNVVAMDDLTDDADEDPEKHHRQDPSVHLLLIRFTGHLECPQSNGLRPL
jgi:hypothetical protein